MRGANRILVVLNQKREAAVLLEKAVALAIASDAIIEVVHIIYEGVVDLPVNEINKNQALKTFIMQSAEAWLEDQLDPIRSKVKAIESATIWNKDKWQGIISAADVGRADLIIKGTDDAETVGLSIRTPEDWNLIRHSKVPVLLVKDDAWVSEPIILAAIEALDESQFDLSKRILREAQYLVSVLKGELAIVVSYPLLEAWVEPSDVPIDFELLTGEIEQAVKNNVSKLIAELDIDYKYLYVEEGKPAMRIRKLVEESNAEILVMGSVGRSGLKGLVVGNTSEMIIHYTECDVVVVR